MDQMTRQSKDNPCFLAPRACLQLSFLPHNSDVSLAEGAGRSCLAGTVPGFNQIGIYSKFFFVYILGVVGEGNNYISLVGGRVVSFCGHPLLLRPWVSGKGCSPLPPPRFPTAPGGLETRIPTGVACQLSRQSEAPPL